MEFGNRNAQLNSTMASLVIGLALALAPVLARELDPRACAARFDVQRDKIIRTEESREMGARYLSELDVGSRHECLRLCCETDACDVFVYEEKSPGSCYLFKCGPPEDFRCKFTAHGNFSSGVLALSRRLAELQDQERLDHRSVTLPSLRPTTSSTSTTTTTTTPPPPPPPPLPDPPRRCSRYQFECRRGGECIAVYNACDGVPQCADGSDEAPELGCPAVPTAARPSTTTVPAATTPPPPPPPPVPQLRPMQEGAVGNQFECRRGGECIAVVPFMRWSATMCGRQRRGARAGLPRCTTAARPSTTIVPAVTYSTRHRPPPPVPQLRPMQVLGESVPEEEASAARWPHRLTMAQPPRRYNGVSEGHIFAHKGGLVQEAEAPPYEPPWRRLWPHQVGSAEWAPPQGAGVPWEDARAWPVPPPERLPYADRPDVMGVYAGAMPEMPPPPLAVSPPLRDQPKKAPPPPQFVPLPQPQPQPQPQPKQQPQSEPQPPPQSASNATKKKALPEHVQTPAPAAAVVQPLEDADGGLSDHPPSAVLLLVLGNLAHTNLQTVDKYLY
ncbi:hypothetical protein ACJJTC_015181 [Scirpophaga incertulas]